MNFPFLKAKERLIRIMGTFDLATGHASTFDELLDSLESELRDVLGHYREALAQPDQEPVGKFAKFTDNIWREVTNGSAGVPLYTTPPQTWVGLTDEERQEIALEVPIDAVLITEARLKDKNNG